MGGLFVSLNLPTGNGISENILETRTCTYMHTQRNINMCMSVWMHMKIFFFKFWIADASHSLKSRCVGVPVLLNPDPGFVPLPQAVELMRVTALLPKDLLKSGDLKWLFVTCFLPLSLKLFRDSCYIFWISLKPRVLKTFIFQFRPSFPPSQCLSRAEDRRKVPNKNYNTFPPVAKKFKNQQKQPQKTTNQAQHPSSHPQSPKAK